MWAGVAAQPATQQVAKHVEHRLCRTPLPCAICYPAGVVAWHSGNSTQAEFPLPSLHGVFGVLEVNAGKRSVNLDGFDLVAQLKESIDVATRLLALLWVQARLPQPFRVLLCSPSEDKADQQQGDNDEQEVGDHVVGTRALLAARRDASLQLLEPVCNV